MTNRLFDLVLLVECWGFLLDLWDFLDWDKTNRMGSVMLSLKIYQFSVLMTSVKASYSIGVQKLGLCFCGGDTQSFTLPFTSLTMFITATNAVGQLQNQLLMVSLSKYLSS